MNNKWYLTEDDQCVAQSHENLAVRRVWAAWLAAVNEIGRLRDKLNVIENACRTVNEFDD